MKFKHSFELASLRTNKRVYKSGNTKATVEAVDNQYIKVKIEKCEDKPFNPLPNENESFNFGDITVKIDTENFLLSYYLGDERLFSDRAPLAYNLENEFGKGVYHYITREIGEKVFGLGDKSGELNKAGRSFKIETTDSMGYDAQNSDPLYKHVPFYICENSVGSYGIYYKTDNTAYIDLGREHNNYYEHYKYFQCDDDSLEYYVFFGTKLEILQKYCRFIGKQAFPPKWSFDYCASTMAYTDSPNAYEEMLGFLKLLKRYDLSCGGFYLSSGYTSIGDQRCVFNWNYDKFPNPKEFIELFKENGIEIIPNIKPSFLVTHPMYNDLAKKGYFVKNPDGTPFLTQLWDNLGSYLDFTNPDAFNFWKEQVKEKLLDLGIVATWNDNNEFDIKDCDAVTFDGNKACELRPYLTYLMVKASHEAQTEQYPNLRPFLSTRSGGSEVRTLAQTWSGDNFTSFKDLRYCHYIGLTMSLSGFHFYGHDLGGFSGEMPSKELFLRWLQHGIFEPRFTIHSWNDDGSATMPWSYPDLMPYVRELFAERKKLIPYLYSSAFNCVENEIPLNAPTFLYYDDEKCYEYPDSMMVGRNILTTFVFDEGCERASVYLPEGDDWYLDGRLVSGGQVGKLTIPAKSKMPFFVKAGSVIPFDEGKYGFMKEERIVFTVYPIKEGTFKEELFFDDGKTFGYQKGECARVTFTVECSKNRIDVHCESRGKMSIAPEIRLCKGEKRKIYIK